jgi:hypothetical protein
MAILQAPKVIVTNKLINSYGTVTITIYINPSDGIAI